METIYLEQHNTTATRSLLDPDIARAEHMLSQAGIGFTEVARCPAAQCEVCDAVVIDVAA